MNQLDETDLKTVSVPNNLHHIFLNAQEYVKNYFSRVQADPQKGVIGFSNERYILVRAASMSKEFFDMMTQMYEDREKRC